MANLLVCDMTGKRVGEIEIAGSLAEFKPNKQVIHDFAVMCRYNSRSWTANTKTRGEVRGGGKKPWRQKGTGRARAGSLTSPIFRGGGTVFGPRTKDVYSNMPKRVRRLALKSIFAQRLSEAKVFILDELKLERPRTKGVVELLKNMKIEGKTLFLLKTPDKNQLLSIRNIPSVTFRRSDNVNAYDILSNPNIVMTKESFNSLIGMVCDERTA